METFRCNMFDRFLCPTGHKKKNIGPWSPKERSLCKSISVCDTSHDYSLIKAISILFGFCPSTSFLKANT